MSCVMKSLRLVFALLSIQSKMHKLISYCLFFIILSVKYLDIFFLLSECDANTGFSGRRDSVNRLCLLDAPLRLRTGNLSLAVFLSFVVICGETGLVYEEGLLSFSLPCTDGVRSETDSPTG